MNLLETIEGMEKAGVRQQLDGERLSIEVDADRPPGAELLAAIKRHGDALRRALAAPAPPSGEVVRPVVASAPRRAPAPGEPDSAQDAEPLDLSPRQLARWRRRRMTEAQRNERAAMLAFGDPRLRGWR